MHDKKRIILKDLNNRLRSKFHGKIKDIVLFGSQASGNAKEDSDYDILVILSQNADWITEREISDICFEIDMKYNIITDTHVLGESELSTLRGKQPIFTNAVLYGIHA